MMRRSLVCAAAAAALLLKLGSASAADAQILAYQAADPKPHFLLASTAGNKPVNIDVERTPILQRRLSLDLAGATLKQALAEISAQSGLNLTYSDDIVPLGKRVHLRAEAITVVAALTDVLLGTGVDVVFNSGSASRAALVRRPPPPPPAVGTITGRVMDNSTGAALEGVSVFLDGTSFGALTSNSGQYRIANVPAGSYNIVARQLGYADGRRSLTVTDGQQATVDFRLETAVLPMDEIVVTGSMTPTAMRAVSHPINVIPSSQIERLNVRNMDDIIRLTVPGALAYSPHASNGVGAAVQTGFRFRGSTTMNCFNCSDVKIFIDGIPIEDDRGGVINIDPSQIERIEAVRGPQASALYGSDALGGVIQIFTKRGQSGLRPQLSFTSEVGWVDRRFDPGSALKQRYSASVLGGTEGATYRLSTSYSRTGDAVPGFSNTNPVVDAAARFDQGPFQMDLMLRVNQSNGHHGYNGEWAKLAAGTAFESTYGPKHQRSELRLQTYGLKLGYQATPNWRHEVTVGWDGYLRANYGTKAPNDGFIDAWRFERQSISYRTALPIQVSEGVQATFTAGGDHNESQRLVGIELSGTNTGTYGQVQLDIGNSIFLNGSLRAERRTANGSEDGGWPVVSKFGATYARTVGENTYKVRASYGSSIRQNHVELRDSSFTDIPSLGWTRVVLPNPNLKPELQTGYDLGVDASFGGYASLSATYYNQAMKDFAYANEIAPYPDAIWRYENVALMRNKGWELEAGLNLGRIDVRGNYAHTSSVPEDLGPFPSRPGLEVGKQLWFAPKHSAALAVTAAPFTGSRISATLSHQGSVFGLDYYARNPCQIKNSPEYCPSGSYSSADEFYYDLPSVTSLNLSAEHELRRAMTIYFKVDDLTNAIRKSPGFNEGLFFGRTVAVGLRARL